MTDAGATPTTAARHFLAGAMQAGLGHVVISPGSRSSPLAVACSHLPDLARSIHLDERVAGFVALGQAKASRQVVALVCTSGTAAANYLPAIAEAGQSGVPLLVITADRPPEHRGWGVGQSFDQLRLYGNQVREFVEMPVGSAGGLQHAVRAGHRAARTARDRMGPVHVNWPFRLPLEEADDLSLRPEELEFSTGRIPVPAPSSAVDRLQALLLENRRTVLIAGPDAVPLGPTRSAERSAIWQFSEAWDIPILSDVCSGLRGAPDSVPVVDAADHVVASGAAPEPSLVLRIGDTPTAKSIRLWWEGLPTTAHVLIDPRRVSHDPSHLATHIFVDEPAQLFPALADPPARTDDWTEEWTTLGAETRRVVDETLDRWPSLTEAHIARELVRVSSADTTVVASSSMPVRDLDSFGSAAAITEVVSNRGINGIDGVVSTAIGVSRARAGRRVVVLIGDVALLHDIGGVLDAARSGCDLTVVVPHNDGGGIFSFLPIRSAVEDSTYRELFHTPHGTDFAFLGAHDGITHEHPGLDDFGDAVRAAQDRAGVTLLTASIATSDNVAAHRAVSDAVARTLPRSPR